MVMPRALSSGALSIESKLRNLFFGLCLASTLVIAAVSVVLPWSMCPIVPILTCGLLRSNFSFAILFRDLSLHPVNDLLAKSRGDFFVLAEMHRKTSAPLRVGANIGGVAEYLRKRQHRLDDLGSAPQFHAFDAAPG